MQEVIIKATTGRKSRCWLNMGGGTSYYKHRGAAFAKKPGTCTTQSCSEGTGGAKQCRERQRPSAWP